MPEQERTESPTGQRRAKARREGHVARSKEIPTVLILLGSLGLFFFAGSQIFVGLPEFMQLVFQNASSINLTDDSLIPFVLTLIEKMASMLAPLLIVVFIAGIAANVVQFGFLFNSNAILPKLSRINSILNPINGMKKFFSMRSLGELFVSVSKLCIIGGISYLVLRNESEVIPSLIQMTVVDIIAYITGMSLKLGFYVCLALLLLACLDYAFQRWQYEKGLRMTRQEIKEEIKQREGDPLIRARIRRMQLEIARRRMMEEVPKADVVVTNPKRLAIALRYDAKTMAAPKVVAKGAGAIAERIKQIATEYGIPIVEHKPLAQALFKAVDIGGYIPVNLYRATAEVLAYVYKLKGVIHHR